jgi:hypothetical protein
MKKNFAGRQFRLFVPCYLSLSALFLVVLVVCVRILLSFSLPRPCLSHRSDLLVRLSASGRQGLTYH